MKNAIIGWLVLALLLTAASYITKPHLNKYNNDDTAFARQYAGEMLTLLEQMAGEAEALAGSSAARHYYLDGADELARRKHAAIHLKGDLAQDFVYAFACAEDWCRASADALYRPRDTAARQRARAALARARAEFKAINVKDYTKR